MPKCRKLDLRSLDEVIAEVTHLRDHGYQPRGRWNLSQICEHLFETMRIGLDGDEPRLSWPQRKIFGLMFRFFIWRRFMPSGAPTIPRLEPEKISEESPEKIERCLATLSEARDFAGPLPPYPVMDGMTLPKWKDLMVIHSQHHLRFLEPLA